MGNEREIILFAFVGAFFFISSIICFPADDSEAYYYEKSFLLMQGQTIRSYMNLSVDPCDDFYEYACGNWHKYNPIPPDATEIDIFSKANLNINNMLREILSDPYTSSELEYKAKLFYSTCLDLEKINQRGPEPLLKFIHKLGKWPPAVESWSDEDFDLIKLLVEQQKYGHKSLLSVTTDVNLLDNEINSIFLDPPQLHKENLIDENAYKAFIVTVLNLLTIDHDMSEMFADQIIKFEIKLKNLSDYDDLPPSEYFLSMTINDLIGKYPNFPWIRYFNSIYDRVFDPRQNVILNGIPNLDEHIELIRKTDNETISLYVMWQSIYELVPLMDESFTTAFQMLQKSLTGKQTSEERWKYCISTTNTQLEWLIGSMYAKATNFDENTKQDIIEITQKILNQFYLTLLEIDWLDDETRKEAVLKVNNTIISIGYPDFIMNEGKLETYYQNLKIEDEKYFENYINLLKFKRSKEQNRLTISVNKADWPTKPVEANAFFDQVNNRILFAVGLLQPPLYYKDYPIALKFGGAGFFIGHELTHGFDFNGKDFDYKGNLRTWWTDDSVNNFNGRSQCFNSQYDRFELNEKKLSGEKSNTENLADNGGLRQAFAIYKEWLALATPEKLNNERMPYLELETEKLFFLGFAQNWCNDIRPEAIEQKVLFDSHPPGKFRVLGPLQNLEEFSDVFNCPIGSPMNPAEKCRLW